MGLSSRIATSFDQVYAHLGFLEVVRRWASWLCGRLDFALIIVILAAGGLVRFQALGAKSLWFDEALSWGYLEFSISELVARSAEPTSVHPPLYFVLLHYWAAMFGDSEFALRSLAAFCGTATILGVFLLMRELAFFSGRPKGVAYGVALFAAALVAASPLHIHLSQQIRGYSLATALFAWSSWVLVLALRANRRSNFFWIFSAMLAVAFCYTSHLATFSVLAQGFFVAMHLKMRVKGKELAEVRPESGTVINLHRAISPNRTGPCAATLVLLLFYVLPWLPNVLAQSNTVRLQPHVQWPFSVDQVGQEIFRALCGTFDTFQSSVSFEAWLVTALLGAVLSLLIGRGHQAEWFIVLTATLPLLLVIMFSCFSKRSIVHARYLSVVQLSWLCAIALSVFQVPFKLQRGLVAGLVLSWSLYLCAENWPIIGPSANPGMRAAVKYILDQMDPEELIVARSPFVYYGSVYYARAKKRPLLCVREARRECQIGPEHWKNEDLITPDSLVSYNSSGIWFISSDSYVLSSVLRFNYPDDWILLETREFAQDYYLEKPVVVEHYKVRPHF